MNAKQKETKETLAKVNNDLRTELESVKQSYLAEFDKANNFRAEKDNLIIENNKLEEKVASLEKELQTKTEEVRALTIQGQESLNMADRRTGELSDYINFETAFLGNVRGCFNKLLSDEEIKKNERIQEYLAIMKNSLDMDAIGRDSLIRRIQAK